MAEPGAWAAWERALWRLVWQIPRGRVSSYGRLATMLPPPPGVEAHGYARIAPRRAGYALARCMRAPQNLRAANGAHIPWQRVLNGHGRISLAPGSAGAEQQRALLEAEGLRFDGQGRVDLSRFGWP